MNKSLILFITLLLLNLVAPEGKSSALENFLAKYPLTPDAKAQLVREISERIKLASTQEKNLVSSCPICMEEFADLDAFGEDAEIVTLSCGHSVCNTCDYNGQLKNCPLCRAAKQFKSTILIAQYRDLIATHNAEYRERRARTLLEAEEEAARRQLWSILQNGLSPIQASISSGFVAIAP